MVVTLRPAGLEDEQRLLDWRNEPTTRAASLTSDVISTADHAAWFARKLSDPSCALYIVMDGREPVGQVRLDRLDSELAEVSIGLAPEARGRGVGRQALALAVMEARRLGAVTLTATVRPDNVASLRSFEAAGFSEFRREDDVVELRGTAGD